MDNSNMIISVIIVLCIAAGVTAYGVSEGENAVFTDLSGFSPDSSNTGDDGIGNTTGDNYNNEPQTIVSEPATTTTDSGSSSSSSGTTSDSGSSSGTSSGSSSGTNSGTGTGTSTNTDSGNGDGSGTNTGTDSGNSDNTDSGNGDDSGGDAPAQDIGYDACLAKAQSLAGDATFDSATEDGDYRIFYFSKTLPESEQNEYSTDTFGIAVNKYTGSASLY